MGSIAFVIDAGITLLLAKFIHYIAANTVGFIVANLVNFLLAHKWVFHGKPGATELSSAYLPVLVISVIGLLLSNLCMFALIGIAGLQLLPAKIFTTLIVLVWNFFGRIGFVYNKS